MRLTYAQWVFMRDHIVAQLPEEACGLIGGVGDEARLVLPVTNELHSPVRFRMSPQEQLEAFLRFEEGRSGTDRDFPFSSSRTCEAFPYRHG